MLVMMRLCGVGHDGGAGGPHAGVGGVSFYMLSFVYLLLLYL